MLTFVSAFFSPFSKVYTKQIVIFDRRLLFDSLAEMASICLWASMYVFDCKLFGFIV